ncbi:hypothetical protein [Chitinophaga cymbidii]|uniref:YD repeat-containing protein n=1 Tax=Chitinophaga cymbidii TaxID=1096750 RepID=A0A512RTD0_9BACT|nr:hypothetical protein [Chitinophaga cymbidii]GEP98960.1 hypothetical protein CCY01nite_52200 [Chitinophaga cymbidii]
MKKFLSVSCLCIVAVLRTFAQPDIEKITRNKIIYPSPTATSLGKYGEFPVSLYNGLVNIEQGLLNIKSGSLSLDVSLSYHSGGNKPADIPGWVGLGFSLNAGGVITRVARDIPDDLTGGFYASINEIKPLLNNYIPTDPFLEAYVNRYMDINSDKYLFNFCGRSGEFVFDWNQNVKLTKKAPLKVQVNYLYTYGFQSFVITTEDGVMYTFDQLEKSAYIRPDNQETYYTSSWYLSKIKNLSGDSIVLKYVTPTNNHRYKRYPYQKFVIAYWGGIHEISHNINSASINKDFVIYLDEIIFNGGKLSFPKSKRNDPYYTAGASGSIIEEKKLDAVVLSDTGGNVLKRWDFQYIENNTERLKLQSLRLRGADTVTDQLYVFSYNPVKLPVNTAANQDPYATNSVDYWGYYNGAPNTSNRIPLTQVSSTTYYGSADRNPRATEMKAEILSKITYPTGGYTEFDYDPHDYSSMGESFSSPPAFEYHWDEPIGFEFEDGYFQVDPATLTFTLTGPTLVKVSRGVQRTGPNCAWMPTGDFESNSYVYSAGTYNLRTIFNTDELLAPTSSDVHRAYGTVEVRREIPIVSKMAGGLRIKRIRNFDGTKITTRDFEYKLSYINESSGVLSMFPTFHVRAENLWQNMIGLYSSSDPINDMPEGAAVGYSRVVEKLEDSSSIVHEFTTYDEYPDIMTDFSNGFSDYRLSHLISRNHFRGFEKSVSYYNSSGNIVKQINNTISHIEPAALDIPAVDIKPTFNITFLDYNGNLNHNPIAGLLITRYDIPCRYVYNMCTVEETYSTDGSNSIVNSKKIYYDNPDHLQPSRIEVVKSDGSKEITCTTYPDDYPAGTAFIDYMKANNMVAYPVEQVVYKEVGTTRTILSGNITKYRAEGKGLVDQILMLETPDPVPLTSFKFSNRLSGILPPTGATSVFSPDSKYKIQLTFNSYDTKGNPLQYTTEGGVPVSYLWGYNGQFPVAEIKNATAGDIAYTSFESDGKGNWVYNGASSTDMTSPTGRKCYSLSGGAVSKSGLNSAKQYVLTYWAKSTSAGNISGGVASMIDLRNGWSLYSRVLTNDRPCVGDLRHHGCTADHPVLRRPGTSIANRFQGHQPCGSRPGGASDLRRLRPGAV